MPTNHVPYFLLDTEGTYLLPPREGQWGLFCSDCGRERKKRVEGKLASPYAPKDPGQGLAEWEVEAILDRQLRYASLPEVDP